MKDENQSGWYALYLSITQNISPAHALSAMDGKRRDFARMTWEEFVEVYRAGEAKIRAAQRKRSSSEKSKNYQREYRRLHPMTEEQRKRRAAYLRRYRSVKVPEAQKRF